MNKEQTLREIEKTRAELNDKATSKDKLAECQELSEKLDELIAIFMKL